MASSAEALTLRVWGWGILWGLVLLLTPGSSLAEGDADPPDVALARDKSGFERKRLSEKEEALIRRPDERRPEYRLTTDLWGRPLVFGGDADTRLRLGKDVPFKDQREDDLVRVSQTLTTDFFYRLTEATSVYFRGSAFYRSRRKDFDDHRTNFDSDLSTLIHDDRERERGVAWREGWIFIGNLFDTPLSIQLGRQRVNEAREWWWDEDLDAVRLRYDRSDLHFELAVAQQLARRTSVESHIDPEEEDVLRFLGRATWEWTRKNRLQLYLLSQNDHSDTACPSPPCRETAIKDVEEDESDANLTWLGASADGRWGLGSAGRLYYWADTAVVGGRETFLDYSGVSDQRFVDSRTRHGVHGWGFDLGATWQTRLPGRPSLTLGYAMGSGDVRSDSPKADDQKSNDHSFRQTSLQDNNDRFRGVNSFKYYGELLRPELSNLRIATAALGFRFLKNSSVELIYHSYQQVEAAKFLRKATVRRQPAGRKRGIGHELDLVIGIEEWEHFEIELIAAGFRAGPAFGAHCDGELFLGFICEPVDVVSALDGEWSYLGLLKFKFNF
ncbi:MAG: hypothetical protein E2O71_03785 [Deltaproteobacteria bacterium]|nr:MAG: hypothetical protein E2O71_03785 [Deltaproteobacteria bacterium]